MISAYLPVEEIIACWSGTARGRGILLKVLQWSGTGESSEKNSDQMNKGGSRRQPECKTRATSLSLHHIRLNVIVNAYL